MFLKRLSLWISISALLVCPASGLTQIARLLHQPVTTAAAGAAVTLEINFTPSLLRVYQARVYYRNINETTFHQIQMTPEGSSWTATIPAAAVKAPRMQYFISAAVDNETVLSYPEFNPYNRPEEILVAEAPLSVPEPMGTPDKEASVKAVAQAAAFPEFQSKPAAPADTSNVQAPVTFSETTMENTGSPLLFLSPDPDEEVAADELSIAVSLITSEVEVDSGSIKIWLDGADMTTIASISASLVILEPKHLKPGKHAVEIEARSIAGMDIPPVSLSFRVAEEKQKPAVKQNRQIHIFADGRSEQVHATDNAYYTGGFDFNGQYGGLHYQGNVYLTSQEDRTYQPRNQYYMTLYTSWLGIAAGDNHPMYNPLILWGKRVRGLSGFLHLGFINVDFISGETSRAIEGRTLLLKSASGADSVGIAGYGTYGQDLIGIRPSLGSGKRFQLGLSLIKVKDQIKSITYGTKPKDNLVFGPDMKIVFDRGRFVIEANAAMSFLTDNTAPGSINSDDVKRIFGSDTELPIDPQSLEKYLVINESTSPINPLELSSVAYDGSIKLDYFHNLLQVGYKSIGGAYLSLANAWLRKDIAGLYFSDRIRLFKNKLYVNLGYEDYLDNFSEQNANPAISLKTLNYGITFYPGMGLPQLTLSKRDHHRDNGVSLVETRILNTGLTLDTTLVDNRERTIYNDLSAQLGYDVHLFDLQHTLNLSFTSSRNIDDYNATRLPGYLSREINTSIAMISWATQFSFPLKATLSYATNQNNGALQQGQLDYTMIGGAAEYTIVRDRLTSYIDGRRIRMAGASAAIGSLDRDQARLGLTFTIARQHTLKADADFINMKTTANSTTGAYTDKLFRIRYDKYF